MYAKVKDGQVISWPYTWDLMRRENPETSFPGVFIEQMFIDYGAVPVKLVERPPESHLYNVNQETPQFIDGVLTQVWSTTPTSEEEAAERTEVEKQNVRATRNELLAQCDYTQTVDYDSGVDRAAWAAYRQALRDITTQEGFPFEVEWPEPPQGE